MSVWQRLFGHTPTAHVALAAVGIAVAMAWVISQFAVAILRRSFTTAVTSDPDGSGAAATRTLIRVVRILLLAVLTVLFIPPALDLFGSPLADGLRLGTLTHWFLNSGLRVLLIVALAIVLMRVVGIAVGRLEGYLTHAHGESAAEQAKRARTLGDLIRNVLRAFIVATGAVMILDELGVNTAPLLTGAGIVGLAIGFGAQTLVKDVISGFFLILENQIRVGDTAEINGTGGLVEAITLRTIVLRDVRGAVHVFPCGSVNTLANLTKDYSYAVLDVAVHYRHDTDEVIHLLREVSASIEHDPAYESSIMAPLEVLGVESLGDSGVTIRMRIKTLPQRQWEITRELRRRVKKMFDEHGIEIPTVPLAKAADAAPRDPGADPPRAR